MNVTRLSTSILGYIRNIMCYMPHLLVGMGSHNGMGNQFGFGKTLLSFSDPPSNIRSLQILLILLNATCRRHIWMQSKIRIFFFYFKWKYFIPFSFLFDLDRELSVN